MALKRIFISSHSFSNSSELKKYAIEQLPNCTVDFNPSKSTLSREDLISHAKDSELILVGHETVDHQLFSALPNLNTIAKYGVGMDNIKLDDCRQLDKSVLWCPGVNADFVAEHTLGLSLSLMRNIYHQTKLLKENVWHRNGGSSLKNKYVAIIGVGHVGSATAKLFSSFGSQVCGVDILDKNEFLDSIGAKQVSLTEALELADIISLHLPLTSKTNQMIDKTVFKQVHKPFFLVNTSRGSIVSEEDMLTELDATESKLLGAGLDVFEGEPNPNKKLLSHSKIICTPHIAANCIEAKWAMGTSIIKEIKAHLSA